MIMIWAASRKSYGKKCWQLSENEGRQKVVSKRYVVQSAVVINSNGMPDAIDLVWKNIMNLI